MNAWHYGIIYYSNPNSLAETRQRVWESPIFDSHAKASASVFDEIATGRHNGIVGVSWEIVKIGE